MLSWVISFVQVEPIDNGPMAHYQWFRFLKWFYFDDGNTMGTFGNVCRLRFLPVFPCLRGKPMYGGLQKMGVRVYSFSPCEYFNGQTLPHRILKVSGMKERCCYSALGGFTWVTVFLIYYYYFWFLCVPQSRSKPFMIFKIQKTAGR